MKNFIKEKLEKLIQNQNQNQNQKIAEAIEIFSEKITEALPNEPILQKSLMLAISDVTNTFFGIGNGSITTMKAAMFKLQLPPVFSTKDGQRFIQKLQDGDFKNDINNKIEISEMSYDETKLFEKYTTWLKMARPILNQANSNLFYNVFPERYEEVKKNEFLKEKSNLRLIEEAKKYDQLVKEDFENYLLAYWREPLNSSKTDGAKKDSIKRQISLYQKMSFSRKLNYLTKFKKLLEDDYEEFIKKNVQHKMLNAWIRSIESNSPNKNKIQQQMKEYNEESIYLKWKTLKRYATTQNIASTIDFQKNIDNFNAKTAQESSKITQIKTKKAEKVLTKNDAARKRARAMFWI